MSNLARAIVLAWICVLLSCGTRTSVVSLPGDGAVQQATSLAKRFASPGVQYPWSVVPGGVRDAVDVESAARRDPVVAAHYAGLQTGSLQVRKQAESRQAFVSYRIHDRVYWTRRPVTIRAGETILTDGVMTLRARCGNQISPMPREPVALEEAEPSEVAMDQPTLIVDTPDTSRREVQPVASPVESTLKGLMASPTAMVNLPDQPETLGLFPGEARNNPYSVVGILPGSSGSGGGGGGGAPGVAGGGVRDEGSPGNSIGNLPNAFQPPIPGPNGSPTVAVAQNLIPLPSGTLTIPDPVNRSISLPTGHWVTNTQPPVRWTTPDPPPPGTPTAPPPVPPPPVGPPGTTPPIPPTPPSPPTPTARPPVEPPPPPPPPVTPPPQEDIPEPQTWLLIALGLASIVAGSAGRRTLSKRDPR